MADIPPPRRRLRLHLTIDADDVGDLIKRLNQIEADLCVEGEKVIERVSGGGYVMRLEIDHDQTPEKYAQELEEWFEATRKPAAD